MNNFVDQLQLCIDNNMKIIQGDNDSKGIISGKKNSHPNLTNPVKSLQTLLKQVGVYDLSVDGDFGKGTQRAIKLFSWNINNIPYRRKGGVIYNMTNSFCAPTAESGTIRLLNELISWTNSGYSCTGDLIRFRETNLMNTAFSPTFSKINNVFVKASEGVCSLAFYESIKTLDEIARQLKITIQINQVFRQQGIPPKGAVVTPATKSQHLIGHAIDLNLKYDGKTYISSHYKSGNYPDEIQDFIDDAVNKGLRWGGNFANMDAPHYDLKVDANTFDYEAKYYFNQKSINLNHMIPLMV